jgi:hypothetical protein
MRKREVRSETATGTDRGKDQFRHQIQRLGVIKFEDFQFMRIVIWIILVLQPQVETLGVTAIFDSAVIEDNGNGTLLGVEIHYGPFGAVVAVPDDPGVDSFPAEVMGVFMGDCFVDPTPPWLGGSNVMWQHPAITPLR